MKKLSILIPTYNEKNSILKIIKRIEAVKLPDIQKEIIIVDDCSTDGTRDVLKKIHKYKIYYHNKNMGKGAAIRTAAQHYTGDVVLIQDADLEYNPNDYEKLIEPILHNRTDVVYGSRFTYKGFKPANRITYLGNIFLSFVTKLLYFRKITDMETCYKVFRKGIIETMNIQAKGFEFEPEITTKIIKKGYTILEVPVRYHGRTEEEGKKLKPLQDGLKALFYLLYYRFFD